MYMLIPTPHITSIKYNMPPKSKNTKAPKSGKPQPQLPPPHITVSKIHDDQQQEDATPTGTSQEPVKDTYESIYAMLGFDQDLAASARQVTLHDPLGITNDLR